MSIQEKCREYLEKCVFTLLTTSLESSERGWDKTIIRRRYRTIDEFYDYATQRIINLISNQYNTKINYYVHVLFDLFPKIIYVYSDIDCQFRHNLIEMIKPFIVQNRVKLLLILKKATSLPIPLIRSVMDHV
jgi:hypothetical protein